MAMEIITTQVILTSFIKYCYVLLCQVLSTNFSFCVQIPSAETCQPQYDLDHKARQIVERLSNLSVKLTTSHFGVYRNGSF